MVRVDLGSSSVLLSAVIVATPWSSNGSWPFGQSLAGTSEPLVRVPSRPTICLPLVRGPIDALTARFIPKLGSNCRSPPIFCRNTGVSGISLLRLSTATPPPITCPSSRSTWPPTSIVPPLSGSAMNAWPLQNGLPFCFAYFTSTFFRASVLGFLKTIGTTSSSSIDACALETSTPVPLVSVSLTLPPTVLPPDWFVETNRPNDATRSESDSSPSTVDPFPPPVHVTASLPFTGSPMTFSTDPAWPTSIDALGTATGSSSAGIGTAVPSKTVSTPAPSVRINFACVSTTSSPPGFGCSSKPPTQAGWSVVNTPVPFPRSVKQP